MFEESILSPEDGPQPTREHTGAPYTPPARACLVCGATAWSWNAETQAYACAGDTAKHQEYATWHKDRFPWLVRTAE